MCKKSLAESLVMRKPTTSKLSWTQIKINWDQGSTLAAVSPLNCRSPTTWSRKKCFRRVWSSRGQFQGCTKQWRPALSPSSLASFTPKSKQSCLKKTYCRDLVTTKRWSHSEAFKNTTGKSLNKSNEKKKLACVPNSSCAKPIQEVEIPLLSNIFLRRVE
jgi:hypothetical protein